MSENKQLPKSPKGKGFNSRGRFGMIFFVIVILTFVGYTFFGQQTTIPKISYTEFIMMRKQFKGLLFLQVDKKIGLKQLYLIMTVPL